MFTQKVVSPECQKIVMLCSQFKQKVNSMVLYGYKKTSLLSPTISDIEFWDTCINKIFFNAFVKIHM